MYISIHFSTSDKSKGLYRTRVLKERNAYHANFTQVSTQVAPTNRDRIFVLRKSRYRIYRFTSERYRERGNTQDKRRRTGKRCDIADAHGQQTRITCTVCTHAGIDVGLYT